MTVGRIPVIEGGIQPTIFDAKADLLTATANDTPARLAVGTNGQVLTADSSTATGLKWAAVAAGGKVLQVVSATYSTATTVSSSTFTDTGLSLSITPTLSTSKIMVIISQPTYVFGSDNGSSTRLLRSGTEIWTTGTNGYEAVYYQGAAQLRVLTPIMYLDSPATTSSTTYKTQGKTYATGGGIGVTYQDASATSTITLMEIGA